MQELCHDARSKYSSNRCRANPRLQLMGPRLGITTVVVPVPPSTWKVIRRAQITGIGQPLEAGASGEGSQAACVVARAYGRSCVVSE